MTRENIYFFSQVSIYLILIYEISIVINFAKNPYLSSINIYWFSDKFSLQK